MIRGFREVYIYGGRRLYLNIGLSLKGIRSSWNVLSTILRWLFIPMVFSQSIYAADSYRVNNGTNQDINEHGVCRNISNSIGQDLLVPTRSSAEWLAFRNNLPALVSSNICSAPPGFNVSTISGDVDEDGATATLDISLASAPTANVTVGITSSDTSEGTVSPSSLVFTSGNWSIPQTVTVTGQNDGLQDGIQTFNVVTAPATSTDTGYNGLDPANVSVNCLDNDSHVINLTAVTGDTVEDGTTAQFTAVLGAPPTANVSFNLTSTNTAEGTVSPGSLTFTTGNWSTPQYVTITGQDDLVGDGNQAYTIVTSAATSTDTNYNGYDPLDVALTNIDDDSVGISVSPLGGLSVSETGTTDTFSVVLTSAPGANVTISVASSDTTEGVATPSSLVFTPANWSTPQVVTVTGQQDVATDGNILYNITLGAASSTDTNYSGIDPTDPTITTFDDDSYGFTISPTSSTNLRLNTSEQGAQAQVDISLTAAPSADVTVSLTSNDTSEGTVSPSSVVFSTLNWNSPQTVTVTGQQDVASDGPVNYQVVTGAASSTDTNYSGLNPNDIFLTNLDDDSVGVTRTTDSTGQTTNSRISLFEWGNFSQITYVLNSQPSANVTLTVTSSDTSESTVSPANLVFTPANWNVPQIATVTGVDDALADGNRNSTLSVSVSSTDTNYNGIAVDDTYFKTWDDEGIKIIVFPDTAGSNRLPVSENLTQQQLGIVLSQAPTADVTFTIFSNKTDEGIVSPTSFTFTPDNWSSPQYATVTGVDDALTDGDVNFSIRFNNATSADGNWDGVSGNNRQFICIDND